jgi:carboxylesterase
MSHPIRPGSEPWSHLASPGAPGALCIHGFTGNPGSMRGVAEAFASAGFHVELPRLPGHGTHIDDMLTTSWADWSREAEAAYQRLAARTSAVVVAGQSMGGSLALWLATRHPEIRALVLVNPAAQPQTAEVVEMLDDFVQQGMTVLPGIGSDIADPDSKEDAYEGMPITPLLSLTAALSEIAPAYPSLAMPLLLLNSPQDHVVDPAQGQYLADHYGGPVERVLLERSYHVATMDFDKELIHERAVAFGRQVTAA